MASLTRNQESRANEVAIVNAPRSKFNYGQDAIFDFKMGEIIPFFNDITVMPGDQFKLDLNIVLRLANPPLYPIMSPLYLDVYAFFVPDRLVWEHMKEFWGENPDGSWALVTEYTKPKLLSGENGFTKHSQADYIYGTHLGVANLEVDARPVRCMTQIYNDWFRNQSVIAPYQFEHGDTDVTFDEDDETKGGKCYKIAKYGDIFTRSTPSAIKGDEVTIPIGSRAPIYGTGNNLTFEVPFTNSTTGKTDYFHTGSSLRVSKINNQYASQNAYNVYFDDTAKQQIGQEAGTGNYIGANTAAAIDEKYAGIMTKEGQAAKYNTDKFASGIYADLSDANAAGMNQLIEAMAVYDILYRMGVGGSRLTEIYRTFWGVHASDARLQRSEYLGGFSTGIDMTEVPQLSATTETSAQGNVAAFSRTALKDKHIINKGFVEHGTIMMVLAVRQRHYYEYGIERCYTTFRKYDNYMPPLANLGPMEVKKKEIYADGTEMNDEATFGFQEAWYWMRGIRPSKIMGDMRNDSNISLSAWHLADDMDSAPVLSQEFIEETDENLQRVINVPGTEENPVTQFICTTFVHGTVTRVMPTSSIPTLRTFF